MKLFSPRAWRCFQLRTLLKSPIGVFSTCVEVFLSFRRLSSSSRCFLHVRGGVSPCAEQGESKIEFSPRAWRCFHILAKWLRVLQVFSTCVEVFLSMLRRLAAQTSFLHVRGGVSSGWKKREKIRKFSPRAWRCFYTNAIQEWAWRVFSTCVEVFLQNPSQRSSTSSFLHVRGGVSGYEVRYCNWREFSPRAWRCFRGSHLEPLHLCVFSTCVEVFPARRVFKNVLEGFLHVRGGVSTKAAN